MNAHEPHAAAASGGPWGCRPWFEDNRCPAEPGYGQRRPAGAGAIDRRIDGSATVELVVMAPFILAVLALVWDLREYISYRTDLAREMFVVAELIANETDGNPMQGAMPPALNRLGANGGGTVAVAVVTRGEERWGGADEPCPDEAEWCLPRVVNAWPENAADGRFGMDEMAAVCDNAPSRLPPAGAHFQRNEPVLPNENPQNADPAPVEPEWISRNMRPAEWWVVVESCFHPNPGLFFGRLVNLGIDLFDVSGAGFVLRKRAAWGSVHDRADCAWCEPEL